MKVCDRTNCIMHVQNNKELSSEEEFENGCTALNKLYKDNYKCRFFKEVSNGDHKADEGRKL